MANQIEAHNQIEQFQAMSSYARAPVHVSQRFVGSYGVRTSLFRFLEPLQVAQFQILSRRFYWKWIAEV